MNGRSMNTGNTTAGGYPDFSQYCPPTDKGMFEDLLWCNLILDGVATGGQLNGLTELGQTARFWSSGKPNIYGYVKDAGLEFDTLSMCPVDYTLDSISYSALKWDVTDANACRFPEMRKKWHDDVPRAFAQEFEQKVLCWLPAKASSCTQGTKAGAGGDTNLGTITAPVALSGAFGPNVPAGQVSIFQYMTRGPEVMASFRLPVNGNVVAFVPQKLLWAMSNSEFANNASINGQGSSLMGTALNGVCNGTLSMRCGAEIRASECISQVGTTTVNGVAKPVYRVLWVWKPGFSAVNKPTMMVDGENAGVPMARLDIRMTISGAAVSRAEGVAVGYVYLAD